MLCPKLSLPNCQRQATQIPMHKPVRRSMSPMPKPEFLLAQASLNSRHRFIGNAASEPT